MQDAPGRVERVLNLLALLLDTKAPLTRNEIVKQVSGYPEQATAYRRAFERDKEALRAMGVPVTTETIAESNDVGYRVRPDDYYLPDLGLTPEETAALHVAVSAISLGNAEGVGALMKLSGQGVAAVAPLASLPLAPALATLFEAFRQRAVVTFTYRGQTRVIEPWGLSSKRGHWYVVGYDRDREAVRAFRADRIEGDVEIGAADAFEAPASFRPDDHVEARPWLMGDEPPTTVTLRLDGPHRDALVAELGPDATIVADTNESTTVELVVTNRAALRATVLTFLEHAEILGPDDVRADLVAHLERVAERA
jgi:predicted DNA-binding transcriptional regulator YafY